MKKIFVLLPIIAMAACQPFDMPEELSPPIESPTHIQTVESDFASPTEPDMNPLVELAVQDLATRLKLDPQLVTIIDVQSVTWPDASLGCPQEGMMYAQVLTDGYQIILSAGGNEYIYHSDTYRNVFLCTDKTQTSLPPFPLITATAAYDNYPTLAPGALLRTPELEEQAPVAQAKEQLSRKLNIPVDKINIFSVLAIEWPDASLGCPRSGMTYANVVTPGYQIALEWNRSVYTFHTDTKDKVTLCHVQPPHEIYSEP